MREVVDITKALADKNRLRILSILGKRELCLCQITELLQLAPSTVSKHLSILRHARLVDSRKEGRWVHYRLADEQKSSAQNSAIQWVLSSLKKSKVFKDDMRQLKIILKTNPEATCK